MLLTSSVSLLISTLFLSATSTAAPTRTHCRCTIISDAPPPTQQTPSSAHWTPLDPLPSPSTLDKCTNLGPELENFRHTQPSLYDSYLQQSRYLKPYPRNDAQHQLTSTSSSSSSLFLTTATTTTTKKSKTTLLWDLAARHGFQHSNNNNNDDDDDYYPEPQKEPRPTSRPRERIVCHSEPEPFSAYQDSFVTLWALHVIVALAILACAAEGLHMGMRWFNQPKDENHNDDLVSEKPKSKLRLTGAERLLCAFPTSADPNIMFSPGVEKKTQAYYNFVARPPCEKREFIAYDDDDEANRPVM